jgi:hypothetical protein
VGSSTAESWAGWKSSSEEEEEEPDEDYFSSDSDVELEGRRGADGVGENLLRGGSPQQTLLVAIEALLQQTPALPVAEAAAIYQDYIRLEALARGKIADPLREAATQLCACIYSTAARPGPVDHTSGVGPGAMPGAAKAKLDQARPSARDEARVSAASNDEPQRSPVDILMAMQGA